MFCLTDFSSRTGGLGAVSIGRNEGAGLGACLGSFPASVRPLVHVDSEATDGSVAALWLGARGVFMVLAKLPGAMGVLQYWGNRLRRRKAGLIEYK